MAYQTGFDAWLLDPPLALPSALVAPQSVTTLRYSDRGYMTRATDTPAHTLFPARVMGDVDIGQSVIDTLSVGGRVALTASEIELWNGDGALTAFAAEGRIDGRPVVVRSSAVLDRVASDGGSAYASAQLQWRGRVTRVEDNGDRVRLVVSDLTDRLATPLQTQRYDGSGGLGGTADLKGRAKPVSLGWRFNVTPVFVGQADLGLGELPTYQTHSGSIFGHQAVRIRGVVQTLTAGAPAVGQYTDFPALGCFQLGSSPDGQVTCDVWGDTGAGEVATTPAVVRRLLTGYGAGLTLSDIETTSWFQNEAALKGEIGWGVGADDVSLLDAVEQVLRASAAFLCGSRDGRLRLFALGPPAPQPHFQLRVENIVSLETEAPPADLQPPPQSFEVGAARNWTPLTDIAGVVTGSERAALAGTGGLESVLSSIIAARSVRARTLRLDGLYREAAAARARASALRDWVEGGIRVVRLTTDRYLGQMELGLTGRVTYPLFGLQNGWTGLVVGWRERIGARRCEITMIG